MGHYFEAIGGEPVQMLELLRSYHFADLSANQWLALTPAAVVAATLNLDRDTIAVMRKDKRLHRAGMARRIALGDSRGSFAAAELTDDLQWRG